MFKKILLCLLFLSALMADQSVSVTTSINRSDYADKDLQKLQHILLDKAKLEAASQLFGDFIKSETSVKDGSLLRDLILAERGGIVHIKGNPQYGNGKNLGELQVSITAYATQQDIEDMKVHRIDIKGFVYGNKNLTLEKLKTEAKKAFLIEAIAQKRPSIKTAPNAAELAQKLAVSSNIASMDFDPDNLSFKMSGYVEYVPIFLRNRDTSENRSTAVPTLGIVEDTASVLLINANDNYRTTIKNTGNGFVFRGDVYEQIKRFQPQGDFSMRLNMRVMVPEAIEGEKATLQILGAYPSIKGVPGYQLYINDTLLPEGYGGATTEIIHDGAQRYVNVSILINNGSNSLKIITDKILSPLSQMTFAFKQANASENTPAKISTLQDPPERSIYNQILVQLLNQNGVFPFTIPNNTMESSIIPNVHTFFKSSAGNWHAARLSARLLLPDDLEAKKIRLQVNGAPAYKSYPFEYDIYINDTQMPKIGNSVDADVIQGSDHKYVNLSLLIKGSNSYNKVIMSNELMKFSGLHFVASDDQKYFAVPVLARHADSSPVSLTFKNKKYYYTHEITHNGLGFNLPPINETLKTFGRDGAYNMQLNFKLPVPSSIKNDTVTVHANGIAPGSNNYSIAINGSTLPPMSSAIKTKVSKKGGERFVNVSLSAKSGGYTTLDNMMSQLLVPLTGLNFTMSDGKQLYDAPLSRP